MVGGPVGRGEWIWGHSRSTDSTQLRPGRQPRCKERPHSSAHGILVQDRKCQDRHRHSRVGCRGVACAQRCPLVRPFSALLEASGMQGSFRVASHGYDGSACITPATEAFGGSHGVCPAACEPHAHEHNSSSRRCFLSGRLTIALYHMVEQGLRFAEPRSRAEKGSDQPFPPIPRTHPAR